MKRFFSLIAVFVIIVTTLPVNSSATETNDGMILFNDGSYIIIEIFNMDSRTVSTKTASKQYTYYSNSGDEEWKAVLTGTFTYDGTTSTCTASSCSISITNTNWYEVSKTVSKSGNTATVDLTMGRKFWGITISKRDLNLLLTCDGSGNLS